MRGPLGALVLVSFVPASAEAEPSHHQGASPSQLSTAGIDNLTREERPTWDLRAFVSVLYANEKLDGAGDREALAGDGSITNYALNLFGEARFLRAFAASVLVPVQHLSIKGIEDDSFWSLGDTFFQLRYTREFGHASASGLVALKVPGTYPESEATSARQIDQETKLLVAWHHLGGSRLALVAGVGFKVRTGGISDEITPTVLMPVRLGQSWTISPSFAGGVAVGRGEPKDSLLAGIHLTWQALELLEVFASYGRTVWGRNVVDAHIVSAGAGTRF